ncbi:hypothetical protein BDZ89DRAFT_14820 [Hymenopellis radicata]|nr:hypothetical protein BDZ89DRAFT_14820 [Hymenopellis radicata]
MALSQELLDEILDNLDNNNDAGRKALQNCALAGRCLLPRSRTRLFSHIVFDSSHTPARLHALPVKNIAPYVQKAAFLWTAAGEDLTSAAIPAVLQSLTNLKDLAFQGHRITSAAVPSFSVISLALV